jgi:hypothetical protein
LEARRGPVVSREAAGGLKRARRTDVVARRTRTLRVEIDGTEENTRVVDEETGEELPFSVKLASGPELRPGGRECLLLIPVSLDVHHSDAEEARSRFAVLPGGSA